MSSDPDEAELVRQRRAREGVERRVADDVSKTGPPAGVDHRWRLTDETKQIGRAGIARVREAMKRKETTK